MRLITTLVTLALSVNVAAGLVWWVQQGRLDATQAQVAALQQEVRTQSTELLGYTRRCADAAQHIRQLTAVPLTTIYLMEYGL